MRKRPKLFLTGFTYTPLEKVLLQRKTLCRDSPPFYYSERARKRARFCTRASKDKASGSEIEVNGDKDNAWRRTVEKKSFEGGTGN